jgi:hypothetical protein
VVNALFGERSAVQQFLRLDELPPEVVDDETPLFMTAAALCKARHVR